MAQRKNRLKSNQPGPFFVDSSCINCGSCWYIDPEHFAPTEGNSYVHSQPNGEQEVQKALLALVDCPVAAIGAPKESTSKLSTEAFPILVTTHLAGDVYYCGWSSKRSFGASSWLIKSVEGNVLIDSPRWSAPLARRIKTMGGISQIVLTHRDDVADEAIWAKAFDATRWIHQDDADAAPESEKRIFGLDIFPIRQSLKLIPTPGHTKGSMVVVLGDKKQILFSGDHLWWNREKEVVVASKEYCWWNWNVQLESVERLLDLDIRWLLPGHGHAQQFASGQWRKAIENTLRHAGKEHSSGKG